MMDDVSIDDLKNELNVVGIISTAGQGEFPMNSRGLWENLKTNAGPGVLQTTKFAIFSMGDRHYWPRPDEKHYFCKAGTDMDKRFEEIGGIRMGDMPCGVGDDQDDDGYRTGLAKWEPLLWDALGVGGVAGKAKEKVIDDDTMKIESNFLRGTILEGLADVSTGAISATDTKLTKFHGIYQQDDRDIRELRRSQGVEKAYSFMIRVRVPGGVSTSAQYIAMDELGRTAGNGTIKITTRQAYQLHGVVKQQLKQTIADINHTLMDTLAACGDVNRNVMCNPMPPDGDSVVYEQVQKLSRDLSAHLSPRTTAYHEIWLDKKPVAGYVDHEPMYGPTYLPRKFKVSVAVPPNNDVDCYAHCLNYVAIVEDGVLKGYTVLVGGGMGMSTWAAAATKKTYPVTAKPMGFCLPDQCLAVGEAVLKVQRDHGERLERKHARLKYTMEDLGMEKFREEVEKYTGFKLEEARTFEFTNNNDRYGWIKASDGMWNYGMFVENGRVKDTPGYPLKSCLREIADNFGSVEWRLSPNANIYIGNVDGDEMKAGIQAVMDKHKVGSNKHSAMRLSAIACASLPYCALSFAEAERYLPSLLEKLEDTLEEAGLRDDSITIRMTGCPNGCARPYLAEIGLVGRAPGVYNLYLGAGHAGERLSKLYKEAVNEEQILGHLTPLLQGYAKDRIKGEFFGDFVCRTGVVAQTTNGADFHENTKNLLD
jgi:sulfite reductase (NADPH) hemoprotein beta-component